MRRLVIAPGWEYVSSWPEDGAIYANRTLGLKVIVSQGKEADGREWVHASLSRRSRMPTYEDMALVKRLFIGEEKKAIQIFPPGSEHVNIHNFCLHLFHCVDEDVLPDFTRGSGLI